MPDPSTKPARGDASLSETDPFYVGYLSMPHRDARFLRFLVPSVLWVMVFVGFAVVWPSRSPGTGVWETGQPVDRVGLLLAEPYPMLLTSDAITETSGRSANTSGERVTLLTEMGKIGAGERAAPFHGQVVRVRGFRLHREGREILELVPDDDAIEVHRDGSGLGSVPPTLLEGLALPSDAAAISLEGEILDSKCYLGAMKPGDGKGHKACAMLCIRGGIPPLLFARAPDGRLAFWLLLDERGSRIDEDAITLAGEPVVARGRVGTLADLNVLFLEPGGVRRRN